MSGIPSGFMQDAQGRLVPEKAVAEIDKDRDALVREIVAKATELQQALAAFKASAMADVTAFVQLAGEKYEAKLGGLKGNLSLMTFDGHYRLQIAVADRIVFDERLQVAKALIDTCIHKWTAGSGTEIRALVEHAFQTDKEGKINTGRILGLTRLSIDDEEWQNAMQAIRDSIQVTGSTRYMRLYQRIGEGDRYTQIPLDLASV